jgi:vitamin B12 transporter
MPLAIFKAARPSRPLAIVSALVAVFSGTAQAQVKTLEPVVVTATRTAQVAADALSDTVVITADEIARSGDQSLVDLLQRQRGIEIARNGGRGASASVFIRGADNRQNIVLIDGVRTGSSTTGGANWSAIPLSQIDRIEIVYGPLSSLYGADAMGGVVQIFTKKGQDGVTPTAAATVGSYGTRTIEAGLSGTVQRFRFAASASHEEAEGFSNKKPGAFGYNPDRDGYMKDSANGQLGFELAKGHELGLSFLRSRLDSEYDNKATFDDHTVQRLENYALTSKNRLSANWTSNLQVARAYDKIKNFTTTQSFFNTRQTHFSWQNDINLRAADLLQFVLERRHEEVDSSTAAINRQRTTRSAALAYQMKRGAHLASFSLRNDDNSQFGSQSTGSIGYGYRITSALRANASLGTSFRAPTFNELYATSGAFNFGVPTNQPEHGRNAEVGLQYEFGDARWSATYFHNRITDLIVRIAPCPLPGYGPLGCPFNVNQGVLKGLSLAGSMRADKLIYRASLDLQDPKDETTGRRLPRRARTHGTLGLEYDAAGLTTGTELVFSSNRYDDAANKKRLSGYGLVNLYASYALAPNWSLFGRWNNVFDKNYELARGFATEGSSVFVGVRYAPK